MRNVCSLKIANICPGWRTKAKALCNQGKGIPRSVGVGVAAAPSIPAPWPLPHPGDCRERARQSSGHPDMNSNSAMMLACP